MTKTLHRDQGLLEQGNNVQTGASDFVLTCRFDVILTTSAITALAHRLIAVGLYSSTLLAQYRAII